MKKVAVILSGCGFQDGAEVREAVITLLELDKAGADGTIFAPDIPQKDVINHLTGETMHETRNVLVESARIARGAIKPLSEARAEAFDALILPGGFGMAKNLSNVAEKGTDAEVLPELASLIADFIAAKKPIGAICISPAVLVAAIKDSIKPTVTLGPEDPGGMIAKAGAVHTPTSASEHVKDTQHNIISCAAYMTDAPLSAIAAGISSVIRDVLAQ